MVRRKYRSSINRAEIQKVEEEQLNMITPDSDVTDMPYQGLMSNQEYYSRMQNSSFELDNVMNELMTKKFSSNNLRNMSDENAIEFFKALEQAKAIRAKNFLDLAGKLSDNSFLQAQLQLEKARLLMKNKNGEVVNGEVVEQNNDENSSLETTKVDEKAARIKEQHVIRLLQLAVEKKLESQDNE